MQVMSDFEAFRAKAVRADYEKRSAPADDLASTIEKIADRFDEFKAAHESRLELMETKLARPGALVGELTPSGEVKRVRAPSAEERKAFADFLRTGERKSMISAGTSGEGKEAVSPWFDDVVLSMARDHAPLLKIVRTRKAQNFPAKHIVGNSKVMGSGWSSEKGSRSETAPPLPLVVEVQPGEWWALPTITEWALTDLVFDVEKWLMAELVSEYADTLQSAIVSGNGTDKPRGFLAGPTPVATGDSLRAFGTLQYIATGQAAALPAGVLDLLLDTVHSLAWKHRQNASWLMNATTLGALRKHKDTTGQPILIESTVAGMPTRLLGYPVFECEVMPSVAANSFPIAFGDFDAGYVLDEDEQGMRITRDDITTKGFVKYYARRRVGGAVLDSEALKLVKVAST